MASHAPNMVNYSIQQGNDDEIISFHSSSNEVRTNRCRCCGSCSSMICHQLKLPMFALRESPDALIDIKETFAPSSKRVFYGVMKTILLGWTMSVVVMELQRVSSPFWLAYLTNWGLLCILICNALNLSLFLYLCYQDRYPRSYSNQSSSAGCIFIIPWIVSIITINVSLLIVILYWVFEYKEGHSITYVNLMVHGLLALLTTIDVLVINRVPIRFRQILFVYFFQISYFAWTLIHAGLGMGVPRSDSDPPTDDSTDDDALYSVVNWNQRPLGGAIVAIGILLVATPILFFILWSSSLLFKKNYCDEDAEGEVMLSEYGIGKSNDEEAKDNVIDFTSTKLDKRFEDNDNNS